jgi:glycine cleavage system H protein
MYPEDLRYTKEHEWIRVEGESGVVGITDHAQKALGEVVYVELPKVGKSLKAGEVFGTVESVKAVSDLYSPVSGSVIEVNAELAQSPERINTDPHGEAWMIKLRIGDPKELDGLMDAARYGEYVGGESSAR